MTMSETLCPSHAFLRNREGVRLILRGQSLEELAREGCCAIGNWLLGPEGTSAVPGPWIELEFAAKDRAAALAGWFNRILGLAAALRWAPVECQVIAAGDSGIRARVRGVQHSDFSRLEGVTLRTNSHLEPEGHDLMADVLLRRPHRLLGPGISLQHAQSRPQKWASRK
jgi:hypothetical protein